jgi:hypothetical protein
MRKANQKIPEQQSRTPEKRARMPEQELRLRFLAQLKPRRKYG